MRSSSKRGIARTKSSTVSATQTPSYLRHSGSAVVSTGHPAARYSKSFTGEVEGQLVDEEGNDADAIKRGIARQHAVLFRTEQMNIRDRVQAMRGNIVSAGGTDQHEMALGIGLGGHAEQVVIEPVLEDAMIADNRLRQQWAQVIRRFERAGRWKAA